MSAENMKLNEDRRTLEQNITQGFPTKIDLLNQINVELNLLDTCKGRISQEPTQKREIREINEEILAILSNRINDIFNTLFSLYPVEKSSLTNYIEFLTYNKIFITNHDNMLETLMSRYHNDPEVYIISAISAFDDTNNVESARQYISEGIKYHENCKVLYIEAFWIEVQHLEKTAGASLRVAIKTYRNLIKRFEGDMEFHFILLDRAIRLNSVRKLQCIVVRDMVRKYRYSELMWEKLAKLNYNGLIYYQETEQLKYNTNYMVGIINCIKSYEDGLKKKLPLKNKQNLWNAYIDHVIEIRNSHRMQNEAIRIFMDKAMDRAFQAAHDNKALHKVEHYIYWFQNTNMDDRYRILKDSVNVINNNLELWTKLISHYIEIDSVEMAMEAFGGAIMGLGKDSLPLWKMIILYLKNNHSELVQPLYEKGVRFPFEEIYTYVKSNYLEWCILRHGIHAARKLFHRLKRIHRLCKNLYETMVEFELSYGVTIENLMIVRGLHSYLCTEFGPIDVGVWIGCMRFENNYGHRFLVQKIYEVSLNRLRGKLADDMVKKYEILRIEFREDVTINGNVIVIND